MQIWSGRLFTPTVHMGNLRGIDWRSLSPVVLTIDDDDEELPDDNFELISSDLNRSSPKTWFNGLEFTWERIGT